MGEDQLRAEVVEDQVARGMEAARRRAGMTVEEMVRVLRPLLRLRDVPPEKQVRNNWYAWRRSPRSIPAVALVAAARIAGSTVDALLVETVEPSSEGRIARLERRVTEQEQLIVDLRRVLEARAHDQTTRGLAEEE